MAQNTFHVALYVRDLDAAVARYRKLLGQEPAEGKGRWLGQIYTESVQRLAYRQEVVDFINQLSSEDEAFAFATRAANNLSIRVRLSWSVSNGAETCAPRNGSTCVRARHALAK